MRALIFAYIIEEVAYLHAQNAPLEWFSSTSQLEIVPRLLSKICWLCIHYSVIDIPAKVYLRKFLKEKCSLEY